MQSQCCELGLGWGGNTDTRTKPRKGDKDRLRNPDRETRGHSGMVQETDPRGWGGGGDAEADSEKQRPKQRAKTQRWKQSHSGGELGDRNPEKET